MLITEKKYKTQINFMFPKTKYIIVPLIQATETK